VFVNNATAGAYAQIVQSAEYRDAKVSTVVERLPDLVGPAASDLDLRFTGPDGAEHPTAHVILVSNNPYRLHALAGRGARARMDGGVLGVIAARVPTARDAGRLLALEATGRTNRFDGWMEWTAPTFRLDSSAPVELGLDGEALKVEPPLVFETRPLALRVRVPRDEANRSLGSTAVRLASRSTVAELARVAAGRSTAGD
jgi:diacylglycerol kinase family enzyme